MTADDATKFTNNVLIIVDNCNTEDFGFLNDLLLGTGDADIIITTRLSVVGSYDEHIITVESSDPEAFTYSVFEKNYCKQLRWGNKREITQDDKGFIHIICKEIQYNTMIVSMIAVRLREYGDLSIQDCATKIQKGIGTIKGIRIELQDDAEGEPCPNAELLHVAFPVFQALILPDLNADQSSNLLL